MRTYIDMRSVNLGAELISHYALQSRQKYPIRIVGDPSLETRGTLNQSNALSGLSTLYRHYNLQVDDEITVDYDGTHILITPPGSRKRETVAAATPLVAPTVAGTPPTAPPAAGNVFTRKSLKHIHLEAFAERNFREWTPKTEADVYLVFGAISEYTDYKYCCGASQELLTKLGYSATTKPDAILIDRATSEYLIAEFKMWSSEFATNHLRDDIDVLICWSDDATDRSVLPDEVVCLSQLIETGIKDGEIEI